ncbi:MAG: hypothetical protein PSX81_04225 [bacterium]|nr:hypothetical protein [bacterium]
MSTPNIIYLLGAGASAQNKKYNNASKNFHDKLGITRMPLADNFSEIIDSKYISTEYYESIARVFKETTIFSKFISQHNTIDEAMRKLYLNNESELFLKYKRIISLLFFYIESVGKYVDSRYSQFLLTLINNKFELNSNLSILSWNYDNQIEHAANFLKNDNNNDITINSNNYYKINGSAEIKPLTVNHNEEIKGVNEILESIPEIIFAWEETKIDKLKNFLGASKFENENILVAIGYSFPTVNHFYDLEIIKKLKIKKIYYQNKDERIIETCENLQNRFKGIFPEIKFIPITDISRFYIPFEYYNSSIDLRPKMHLV